MVQAVYTGLNIPTKDHVFEREDWVRWTVQMSSVSSQLSENWTYFSIPEEGYGFQSVNFGRKLFRYDSAGRQNWTMCPGGTIDKTTYNAMSWPVQEELGTASGLTVTGTSEYDVNGNLIKSITPVDDSTANDRVTDRAYDWRNRLEKTTTTVQQAAGSSGTWTYITANTYDNLGNVTAVTRYEGSESDSNRIGLQKAYFDVLGRQYRSEVYGVDGIAEGIALISNIYYDAIGRVARNAPAGTKLFTATVYDAIGRIKKSFQAWPTTGDSPTAAPASVSHSVVMEQQEMQWDKASNLVSTIAKQRFDSALDTQVGELGSPSTAPMARVSYFASYADAVGRSVAAANYGTNGGVVWSRSETIPLASDTILVSLTFYDEAGNATQSTDAAGIINIKVFDNADRLVTTIENDAEIGSRTTHYEYTDDAWLSKLISENPVTGTQVTEWLRGVTPSQGSALYSNRHVYQKIYPDSINGGDRVTYLYNRQLQVTGMTDQAGTTHAYVYDRLGRLLTDTVTAFGADIDTTVSKLETTYNRKGLVENALSKGAVGSIINQVSNSAYTLFNQLSTQFQEHTGAVNLTDSLKVAYHYADGSTGVGSTIRPTNLVYPHKGTDTSPVLDYTYASGMAQALNRIDQLKESGSILSSWSYLGLGTVIGQKYDAAANTELTMRNGGTGDAGDPYTGLDRFGRLVETIWKSGADELVHSRYGRNRVGGVEWRRDVKAHSLTPEVKTQDNFYRYDGLQQVTRHDRGDLVPAPGPGYTGIDPNPATHKQQEIFTFDETGNWMTDYNAAASLSQSRTQNAANEITALAQATTVVQPTYDPVGNMRTVPQPGNWAAGYDLKWDAWNRLVQIKNGATTVASYAYDALTRRTITTIGSTERHYYYDNQWRALEERIKTGSSDTATDRQYTWSPFNRWNLIRRKRTTSTTLDETRYVLKDYLDPVALVKIVSSAAVVDERYGYDAFGPVNLMDASFAPRTSSVCDWNFLFHAEFKDLDTGLYNYGYRYYHPELGRWISKDPIGERGGNNLYALIMNNPLNWIDYLGLEPKAPVLPPAPFDNPLPPPKFNPEPPPPADNFKDLGPLPGGFGPAKRPQPPQPPQPRPNPPNPGQQWWGTIAQATQKLKFDEDCCKLVDSRQSSPMSRKVPQAISLFAEGTGFARNTAEINAYNTALSLIKYQVEQGLPPCVIPDGEPVIDIFPAMIIPAPPTI
jgi:RHS repeat-associated protein